MHRFRFGPALLILMAPMAVWSEDKPVPKLARIDPTGIEGKLLICGGGKLPKVITEGFIELAGDKKAHIVIIPTASERADTEKEAALIGAWKDHETASITVLHTRDRKKANDPKFVAPLQKATGVWLSGGSQSRIADAYRGTLVEKELHKLLERGGVIGGSSAGAAIMSKVMIASGKTEPKLATGFDFLPEHIIDQHFTERKRRARLLAAMKMKPGLVGLGLDEGTAVLVRGRRMYAIGDGSAHVFLAASPTKKAKELTLKGRRGMVDLTAMRRSARDRAGIPFPPKVVGVPEVKKGSLVIVGGGGMPRDVVKKFIELAGGVDAPIVVLPTASPDPLPRRSFGRSMFARAGCKDITVLTARKLADVEDPKTLNALKRAKAVWFGGGRQWRFVDAYLETKAHPLFHDVLKRGGVIGGSSAGASIQGEYMARGAPLGNLEIMAEGYERGLGFLPGAAIDQHFSQRRRFKDMTSLVETYPQLLGIGIDEATALVVQGHIGEVMGRGKVHFYDRRKTTPKGKPDYESVPAGGKYDLKARKTVPEK